MLGSINRKNYDRQNILNESSYSRLFRAANEVHKMSAHCNRPPCHLLSGAFKEMSTVFDNVESVYLKVKTPPKEASKSEKASQTGTKPILYFEKETMCKHLETILDPNLVTNAINKGISLEEVTLRRTFKLIEDLRSEFGDGTKAAENFANDVTVRAFFGTGDRIYLRRLYNDLILPITSNYKNVFKANFGQISVKSIKDVDEIKKLISAYAENTGASTGYADRLYHVINMVMDHDFGNHIFANQLVSRGQYRNSFRNNRLDPATGNKWLNTTTALPLSEDFLDKIHAKLKNSGVKIANGLEQKHIEALRKLHDESISFRRIASSETRRQGTDILVKVDLQSTIDNLKNGNINLESVFGSLANEIDQNDIELLIEILDNQPRKRWIYEYEEKTRGGTSPMYSAIVKEDFDGDLYLDHFGRGIGYRSQYDMASFIKILDNRFDDLIGISFLNKADDLFDFTKIISTTEGFREILTSSNPIFAIKDNLKTDVLQNINVIIAKRNSGYGSVEEFIEKEILEYFRIIQFCWDVSIIEEFAHSGKTLNYNARQFSSAKSNIVTVEQAPTPTSIPVKYNGTDYNLILEPSSRLIRKDGNEIRFGFDLIDKSGNRIFYGLTENELRDVFVQVIIPCLKELVKDRAKVGTAFLSPQDIDCIDSYLKRFPSPEHTSIQQFVYEMPEPAINLLRQWFMHNKIFGSDCFALVSAYFGQIKIDGTSVGIIARGKEGIINTYKTLMTKHMAFSSAYSDLILDLQEPLPFSSLSKQYIAKHGYDLREVQFVDLIGETGLASLGLESKHFAPRLTQNGIVIEMIEQNSNSLRNLSSIKTDFPTNSKTDLPKYLNKYRKMSHKGNSIMNPSLMNLMLVFETMVKEGIVRQVIGEVPMLPPPLTAFSIYRKVGNDKVFETTYSFEAFSDAWKNTSHYFFTDPKTGAARHYGAISNYKGDPSEIVEYLHFDASQAMVGNYISPIFELIDQKSRQIVTSIAQRRIDELKQLHPNGRTFKKEARAVGDFGYEYHNAKYDRVILNEHNTMLWYLDAIVNHPDWELPIKFLESKYSQEIINYLLRNPSYEKHELLVSKIRLGENKKYSKIDKFNIFDTLVGGAVYSKLIDIKRKMLDPTQVNDLKAAFEKLYRETNKGNEVFEQASDFDFAKYAEINSLLFMPPSAYRGTDGRIISYPYIYKRGETMPVVFPKDSIHKMPVSLNDAEGSDELTEFLKSSSEIAENSPNLAFHAMIVMLNSSGIFLNFIDEIIKIIKQKRNKTSRTGQKIITKLFRTFNSIP